MDELRKKGVNIINVNRDKFREQVVKAVDMATLGFYRKDWDRIQRFRQPRWR